MGQGLHTEALVLTPLHLLPQGQGMRTVELSLAELQTKFKKHVMPSTIMCAGNRRSEMKEVGEWVGDPGSKSLICG